MRCRRSPADPDAGAAVVDFVLVTLVLVPLVLGIVQVALVMYVRNTLTAAASEGARYAATIDRGPPDGVVRTRERIRGALADRFADRISALRENSSGTPTVEVRVHASVPALGLWGPAVVLQVTGHAVQETAP
jgi:TadE-like protein